MRIPVLRLVHGMLVVGIRIRCGLCVRARVVGVLLYASGGGEGELACWDGGAECPGDEGAEHRVVVLESIEVLCCRKLRSVVRYRDGRITASGFASHFGLATAMMMYDAHQGPWLCLSRVT
jgi:hypothetical protein